MPEGYDDIAIPEIKLIQNVGGDEAKQVGATPGQFYCSITQEILDSLELVVAVRKNKHGRWEASQKNRTYWGREEIEDEPPICASLDGEMSINGDVCRDSCPYQAYNDAPYMLSATERRLKCLPNYNVVGINLGNMMPVLIRCTGISAMAARELNTMVNFHKDLRGGQVKAKLRVSSTKKKTAAGEAFAIKFGNPELIQDEQLLVDLRGEIGLLAGIEVPLLTESETPETPEPESKPAEKQSESPKAEAPKIEEPAKTPEKAETEPLPNLDF